MSRLDDELAALEASDPAVKAAADHLDATILAIGSGRYRVRRVGSSVVHVSKFRHDSVPAERFGRAVRILRASKVECLCGVHLESSDDRPVVVMRSVANVSCRACRHHLSL